MNEKSFSLRRFALSDVSNVIKLFELVFGGRFSPEWWNWKYKENPAGFWGKQGDIWIAENGNEVVGHLAVIPEKIKLGSETVTAAQLVDGATHPEYRRLGIFRKLVREVCSEAESRYGFIFGFPDEFHKVYQRLGWKSFRMVEFLNVLNSDRPLKTFFNNNLLVWSGKMAFRVFRGSRYLSPRLFLKKYRGGAVEISKVERFPDEIDSFWKQARLKYETIIERTAAFLNWRFSRYFGNYQIYLARSVEKGDVVGYMVLKKTEIRGVQNILDIVDLHALPDENKCVLELISLATAIAKNEGLDLIHCRVPKWHECAKIMRKLGFVSLGATLEWVKLYQPRLILYRTAEVGKIPKMQTWFYTLADTDYA